MKVKYIDDNKTGMKTIKEWTPTKRQKKYFVINHKEID